MISTKLYNLATRVCNRFGYYTKNQAVNISKTVGKELVDTARKGTALTKDTLELTVKKHVPTANVNIYTSPQEIEAALRKEGFSEGTIKTVSEQASALYFRTPNANGIYAPKLNLESISNFAHELEPYLYQEHTPKQKFTMKFLTKFAKGYQKVQSWLKIKPKPSSGPSQVQTELELQENLRNKFGLQDLSMHSGEYKDVAPTVEGFTQFLQGKNFSGLSTPEKIDAYIRSITRHQLHPKNSKDKVSLLFTRNTLADEARAYEVSDEVTKYATQSQATTVHGLVSNLYKRVTNVLNGEIKMAFNPKVAKDAGYRPNFHTELPADRYIGPKAPQLLPKESASITKVTLSDIMKAKKAQPQAAPVASSAPQLDLKNC